MLILTFSQILKTINNNNGDNGSNNDGGDSNCNNNDDDGINDDNSNGNDTDDDSNNNDDDDTFLKEPAFSVISSMYCDVNSLVHRWLLSLLSIDIDNVDPYDNDDNQ